MTDKTVLPPDWAVTDAEADEITPDSGFIHDYMEYMKGCTDAPRIFHYGTIVTILSCAVSGADILCQDPRGRDHTYKIPTPIWSTLIGQSGAARKSNCMNRGVHLLQRAKAITSDPEVVLPSDGSLEGWHDFMCEHSEVLLHRDEMSVLFDQARRGYSEGIKNWLMEIHSGMPKRRVTRRDSAAKEEKIIERPRLAILGGIPPAVFTKVAGAGDWNSGFLARFAFWPGAREWYNRYPTNSSDEDTKLTKWLHKYGLGVKGFLYANHDVREVIADWFVATIEDVRETLPDGLYSHFVRYQDLGLRLAAMHAVSQPSQGVKDHIHVKKADAEHAVAVLDVLHRHTWALFRQSGKETEREGEDNLLQLIRSFGKPVTQSDIVERSSMSFSSVQRRMRLLHEMGIIEKKKQTRNSGVTVGRIPWLYSSK